MSIKQPSQSLTQWFAAQVKPRQEELALMHLQRQDYSVLCPRVKRFRRLRGRTLTVKEPLFPGYVFVGIDPAIQGWHSINGTIGVIRLVTFGHQPAALPEGFIEQLTAQASTDERIRVNDGLKEGANVRIIGGPFDDLCGTLTGISANDRVTVLLRLLSGETKVSMSRASLLAA
ncbi:transcriptional activator RfaH [Altererythrobacter confluentis]|uniref:Transcriptional activator RfaH n=1 Tax=Allopontixanthobacter confluentis TaxID=1849021 RepID=A0A6L7GDQ8_9SPHN|nr:transcriptional activator RfaH [Allopontixanthobacter confluentis]MXP13324.1 transcriptional activator RfaH [Allopontixanthobacter confluentis]